MRYDVIKNRLNAKWPILQSTISLYDKGENDELLKVTGSTPSELRAYYRTYIKLCQVVFLNFLKKFVKISN